MDPQQEIATMPGPQWLFGFDISESQRLLFARLYLEFAASEPALPVHSRCSATLGAFIDVCARNGLRPLVRRDCAIDILRRPNFYSWTPSMRTSPPRPATLRSRTSTARARAIIEGTRARLKRRR